MQDKILKSIEELVELYDLEMVKTIGAGSNMINVFIQKGYSTIIEIDIDFQDKYMYVKYIKGDSGQIIQEGAFYYHKEGSMKALFKTIENFIKLWEGEN